MIKKQLLYILPLAAVIAGFALIPSEKDEPTYIAREDIPEFVLNYQVNDTIKVLEPEKKNVNETILITELLKYYHYNKVELNDSVSSVILDSYLASFDNNKMYFLASDIESFETYRFKIDDYLKKGDLSAPYQIFAVFKERYYQRLAQIDELLDGEFNYELKESFDVSRDDASWASTEEELDEVWRKHIKNELLALKLTDKEDTAAVNVLKKRYDRYKTVIYQYKSSDVYQVFMNSYTNAYDPHTSYFNPTTAEEFEIRMSKSLEGIGARLIKEGAYTVVYSVVPGGPAFNSNQIHDNDKIIGVGQDADGEIVDVVGWRNDDVVQLIRGKKGTTVRLRILEAEDGISGKPKVVTLVRDKINVEDTRAEAEVKEFLHDGQTFKLGVITIPSFYKNFRDANSGNEDFNSTTHDVEKLITELQEKEVDGLLIDLRRNGGGALDEAIDLTGLFIKDGPVVQVKDYRGKIKQEDDKSNRVFYDGPLAVLTSRASASASEIFSAAIQDYGRGLVVGEQTFGKGTVQQLTALQRYIPEEKEKLGTLSLTMAKYYRVDGGSTQNIGVTPDLVLPSAFDHDDYGEASYPSALPWDKIPSSEYEAVDVITPELIEKLTQAYNQRKNTDDGLKAFIADMQEIKENRKNTIVSLNLEERKAQLEEEEERRQARRVLEDQTINTETGETAVSPLNLDDQYLQEGLIILANLIAFTDT